MYWAMVIFITDKSGIMELYVDDREDKERIELIQNEFNSDVVVKRLFAGDILIYQQDSPVICIETKTLQDFVSSCRNSRIKKEALKYGYEPLEIDGIRKVINGVTNLKELNKKLLIK